MSETTQQTAPTTTAGETTIKHTYNGVDITLSRMSTLARGDKGSVAYWGVDFEQFMPKHDSKDDAATTKARGEWFATLVKLYGFDVVVDMFAQKANSNLKATQLDGGKDVYDMPKKAEYVKAYIDAEFGATSKGGGGIAEAFRQLKDINAKQAAIAKRMFELTQQLINPATDAATRVKLAQELATVSAEATALTAPAK